MSETNANASETELAVFHGQVEEESEPEIYLPTREHKAESDDRQLLSPSLTTKSHKHSITLPLAAKLIISMECCERFCNYGLRGILTIYLHNALGFTEAHAVIVFSLFSSLAYFTPLLGGHLSDSYLGKYRTVLYFSLLYFVGTAGLSISTFPESIALALIALVFVAVGTGGIKPCVSAFGAEQCQTAPSDNSESVDGFDDKTDHDNQVDNGHTENMPILAVANDTGRLSWGHVSDTVAADNSLSSSNDNSLSSSTTDNSLSCSAVTHYFHVFYFAINIGSLCALLLIPITRVTVGFFAAFAIPSSFLVLSVCVFFAGRKKYIINLPKGSVLSIIAAVCREGHRTKQTDGHHWLDGAVDKYGSSLVNDVKQFLRILGIFATLPMFWALYDQQGSTWILQAKDMNRSFGSVSIPPEQVQIINPILILILIPVVDRLLYPFLYRHNIRHEPLFRIACGMVFTAISFFVSACLDTAVQANKGNIHVSAQLVQYILISFGEILVSVTGLEFAFSEAPLFLRSLILSFFLLTSVLTGIGDMLTSLLYLLFSQLLRRNQILFVFSVLMMLNVIPFWLVQKWYCRQKLLTSDSNGPTTSV